MFEVGRHGCVSSHSGPRNRSSSAMKSSLPAASAASPAASAVEEMDVEQPEITTSSIVRQLQNPTPYPTRLVTTSSSRNSFLVSAPSTFPVISSTDDDHQEEEAPAPCDDPSSAITSRRTITTNSRSPESRRSARSRGAQVSGISCNSPETVFTEDQNSADESREHERMRESRSGRTTTQQARATHSVVVAVHPGSGAGALSEQENEVPRQNAHVPPPLGMIAPDQQIHQLSHDNAGTRRDTTATSEDARGDGNTIQHQHPLTSDDFSRSFLIESLSKFELGPLKGRGGSAEVFEVYQVLGEEGRSCSTTPRTKNGEGASRNASPFSSSSRFPYNINPSATSLVESRGTHGRCKSHCVVSS